MNKEAKKTEILSERIKFLQRIASASQKEVERCLAEIEAASNEAEIDAVTFTAPAVPEGL
jgi:hypothetical protein